MNVEKGKIIDALKGFEQSVLNPLVILDELDKSAHTEVRYSPIPVLHSLLEPSDAKHFVDEFMGLEVDASKVNYIALANSLDNITESIMDRFIILYVDSYIHEQMPLVTTEIVRSILDGDRGFIDEIKSDLLSPKVIRKISAIAEYNPRNVKIAFYRYLRTIKHERTGVRKSWYRASISRFPVRHR